MSFVPSRFDALLDASTSLGRELDLSDRDSGMPRLWRGFMAARILVAGVLLLLLLYLRLMGQPPESVALVACIAYLVLAVWVRVLGRPILPGDRLDPQWLVTVGADVAVFGLLLYLKIGTINFTPLFALPVLLAAVLGPLLLALGTAAAVTLALLLEALRYTFEGAPDATSRYVQAAITGTGLFVVAYLANQLSTRLVRQERVAKGSEMAARAQIQVNQLVIDNLANGVLVVDANGIVHAANPSAREMLNAERIDAELARAPFMLAARSAWQSLADLAANSIRDQVGLSADVTVIDEHGLPRMLRVKTKLTVFAADSGEGSLCVMFMEDLREMEARVRTEKLASMGRMSAAVAHEIRNPLSAISQANALLAEEITQPQQQSLVRMVAQNVHRLSRVVEDVLDVSRVEGAGHQVATLYDLPQFLKGVCLDWGDQHRAHDKLVMSIEISALVVHFEPDHLRRVMLNLLDNALRHATGQAACIQVISQKAASQIGGVFLSVWSDGPPIDSGVQRHLFEPFFSSQSRSTGLGLYICRELCIRHGADITYVRNRREKPGVSGSFEGNEFRIHLKQSLEATQPMPPMTAGAYVQ